MRIISFSKNWVNYITGKPKLDEPEFTTFRAPRKDRDWEVGERVQVFFKNRTPQRKFLGIAEIMGKKAKDLDAYCNAETSISILEAQEDGFISLEGMAEAFKKMHGGKTAFNKLTLKWIERT